MREPRQERLLTTPFSPGLSGVGRRRATPTHRGARRRSRLNIVTYLDMTLRARPASQTPERTADRLTSAPHVDLGDEQAAANRHAGIGPLPGYAAGVGAADWMADLIPHLAYGTVTATTYRALRSRLAGRDLGPVSGGRAPERAGNRPGPRQQPSRPPGPADQAVPNQRDSHRRDDRRRRPAQRRPSSPLR